MSLKLISYYALAFPAVQSRSLKQAERILKQTKKYLDNPAVPGQEGKPWTEVYKNGYVKLTNTVCLDRPKTRAYLLEALSKSGSYGFAKLKFIELVLGNGKLISEMPDEKRRELLQLCNELQSELSECISVFCKVQNHPINKWGFSLSPKKAYDYFLNLYNVVASLKYNLDFNPSQIQFDKIESNR